MVGVSTWAAVAETFLQPLLGMAAAGLMTAVAETFLQPLSGMAVAYLSAAVSRWAAAAVARAPVRRSANCLPGS